MRSINDIYNEMVAAKDGDTRLAGLDSPSATAIWRLIFYVLATVIFATEALFERLRSELVAIRDAAVPGTPSWYRAKALEWQEGYVLSVTDSVIAYSAVDPGAQLIKRAAVTEQPDGSILVKVATLTAPLTALQVLSVRDYFNELHFAGTIFGVISLNPDALRVYGDVYFDPQVGAAETLANIEAAIATYLGELPFNSAIQVSRLTDSIQGAKGVEDYQGIALEVDSGIGFVPVARMLVPLSGWFVVDIGVPISSTLNFVANV